MIIALKGNKEDSRAKVSGQQRSDDLSSDDVVIGISLVLRMKEETYEHI